MYTPGIAACNIHVSRRWLSLILLSSLLHVPGLMEAQEPDPARLDAYLERLVPFGYSGAMPVARGDQVLLSRAYGMADDQRGIPVTTETRFLLASLSKPFTALAILKLVEDEKLALDDNLATIFPEAPDDKKQVTVEALLTHTAAVPEWPGESAVLGRDAFVLGLLAEPLVEDARGSFVYSNSGYQLLAAIVEVASDQPFEEFLRTAIFDPAGMSDSGFVWETFRSEGPLALAIDGVSRGRRSFPLTAGPSAGRAG